MSCKPYPPILVQDDDGFVMESKKKVVEEQTNKSHEENVKIVNWEDYQHEVARLSSLSAAVNEANYNKCLLQEKVNEHLQSEAESLSWSNQLDEMREKLEARKLVMGNTSMNLKVVQEKAKKQEDQLNSEIRSLLMAGTSLSVASRSLQEENNSLAGERGYGHLKNVQKLLRMRQQFMVLQISLLYPVKVATGHTFEQELDSYSNNSKSGNPSGVKAVDASGSLTISGLHLTVLPFKKMSFFTDKKEVQSSATALGYVAHAVSLIAFYLEIPLRYPLRLGGSRTYICDYAPSVEPTSSDFTSISLPSLSSKPMEFPLFLEGQDTTRSAYAVFLLNKDLEQLLNFIGVESLGPRHVLANLKELLNKILSPDYINL
ncbi:putative phosphatidylinositol 3-kinase [Helianthus annuus]|nr:putative phosphatidylinositol 3-kinase [Helianthus annuus]